MLVPKDNEFAVGRIFSILTPNLPVISTALASTPAQNIEALSMARFVLSKKSLERKPVMLRIYVENIVDVAIVECEGSIVRSEDAFQLFKVVALQADARVVVVDLSEVHLVEGDGLSIFLILRSWTQARHIGLKLFNPRNPVRYSLEFAKPKFDFATLNELLALLARSEKRYFAVA